jgi:hypothetical protein
MTTLGWSPSPAASVIAHAQAWCTGSDQAMRALLGMLGDAERLTTLG